MEDFSVAVIGAGAIGRAHIERILRTPGFSLAGVAEPGAAGVRWCEQRGARTFADHRALLEATRPGAVVVATPNATHLAVGTDCLEAGVPVLLEKPVADTVEAGLRLMEAERRTGVPALVGHHRRHNPILQRAREWVREGRLGRVVSATAMASFYKPATYFELSWRRQAGGGPVLINLIHDIDMLLFLLGDVARVQAQASSAVRGFEVEDTAAALLSFTGGTLATLVVSDTAVSPWCWDLCAGEQPQYPRQQVQSHFLCGTHGSLSLPDLSLWNYRGERHWHAELTREQSMVHAQDPYLGQLQHLRAMAEGREQPLCTVEDGCRALQAAEAILRAARSGATVDCEPLQATG